MSFLTSPTRLNEVLIDSDQTWISRKSFEVPSGATARFAGQTEFGGTNAATINQISSGTFNPGTVGLVAQSSSVTTFAATGATANDPLTVNATSRGSTGIAVTRSWVSEADVGAVEFTNVSGSAATEDAQDYRWTATDLA